MKKINWYLIGGIALVGYLYLKNKGAIKGIGDWYSERATNVFNKVNSLTNKIFGKTFKKTKSNSRYKKILGLSVRISDHYVSSFNRGPITRADIELVYNDAYDEWVISLNGAAADLLENYVDIKSNSTDILTEDQIVEMFNYLKQLKKH